MHWLYCLFLDFIYLYPCQSQLLSYDNFVIKCYFIIDISICCIYIHVIKYICYIISIWYNICIDIYIYILLHYQYIFYYVIPFYRHFYVMKHHKRRIWSIFYKIKPVPLTNQIWLWISLTSFLYLIVYKDDNSNLWIKLFIKLTDRYTRFTASWHNNYFYVFFIFIYIENRHYHLICIKIATDVTGWSE